MERIEALRPGMFVLSIDGQKLGRIARVDDEGIDVVLGRRAPTGFVARWDEVASHLKAEVFLRERYRDYVGRYGPRAKPAPQPTVRAGLEEKRFFLFRRSEARW